MNRSAQNTALLLALALLASGCGTSDASSDSAEVARLARSWRFETSNAEKVLTLEADKTYSAWLHELGTNHVELQVGTFYLVATGSNYPGSAAELSYEATQWSCDGYDRRIGEYELDSTGSQFKFRQIDYRANVGTQTPPSDATLGCFSTDGPIGHCNSLDCRLEFMPHAFR